MIRIFYDSSTGVIQSSTTASFASESDFPYIDTDQQIRISDWRVNPQTQQLEPLQVVSSAIVRG